MYLTVFAAFELAEKRLRLFGALDVRHMRTLELPRLDDSLAVPPRWLHANPLEREVHAVVEFGVTPWSLVRRKTCAGLGLSREHTA